MPQAIFTTATPLNLEKQKGVDISIEHQGESTSFNVWCDTIDADNITIRTSVNNGADNLILVTVEEDDFKEPVVTYSDDKSYCYVTFNNHSLHIKLDDEGVVFDVWDSTDDENGSVDTNYILYDELAEFEDFR